MWLVASFDLPMPDAAAAKRYRKLRKKLIACGFTSVQKSVFWRWCEDPARRDGMVRKLLNEPAVPGDILIFSIPDGAFAGSFHIVDGVVSPLPAPPEPWTIFA